MRSISLVFLALLLFAPPADARSPRRTRLAVTEIKPLGADAVKAALLSEIALAEAAADARFDVVGSSDIAGMIGFEKQKQMLGCTEDTACLAEIAGALGVDYVLMGSMGQLGASYRLDLKILEVRRARVASRAHETVSGSEELLISAVQRLVRKAMQGLELPARAAPAAEAATAPGVEDSPRPDVPAAAAPPTAEPLVEAAPAVAQPAPRGALSRTLGIATLAAGGAALVAGSITAGLAWQSTRAQQAAADARERAAFDAHRSAASTRALAADVLLIGGGVLAAAGGVLWLTSPSPASDAPAVGLVPAGAGAALLIVGSP